MHLHHHTAKENYEQLTSAPIPGLITRLAVPTIISMLVTSFYNMADTYFVGKIDTQSTAAVGIVFSLMSIIQAVGFFFGHGSGNYISRRLGAKDVASAEQMASTGFFMAFFAGCVLAVLGLVFLTPLSILLGSTPTILPYTECYLGIILLGTPFMASSLVLNNQMRFQGNATYAMVGIVSGAVLNVALDPLFIFVFGMGVSGAALATVLSQVFAILFAYGTNKVFVFENFNFRLRYLMKEMASFFGCRLFTAVFTYVAMVVMVDGLKIQQDMLCKIAVSGISLVLNYVFSKWLIFRKGTAQKK